MTLMAILAGTLAAGIGSVWLAAALSAGALARSTQQMLSLAAGALLATAFMHLLPEAFEAHGVGASRLFLVLLAGLVFFFLLDKAELWHHGHEHHHPSPAAGPDGGHRHDHDHDHGHDHGHGHDHTPAAHAHGHGLASGPEGRSGGWAVLTGDGVHAFGDGVLIASAFMADLRLGLVAALSVLAHEVPHHMGDLVVLRQTSSNRRVALLKVSLAGAVTAVGGLLGYWLLETLRGWVPYFLVVAASSFIYVALADLIPQLQKRLGARQTLAQIAWLLAGIGLVSGVSSLVHHG